MRVGLAVLTREAGLVGLAGLAGGCEVLVLWVILIGRAETGDVGIRTARSHVGRPVPEPRHPHHRGREAGQQGGLAEGTQSACPSTSTGTGACS